VGLALLPGQRRAAIASLRGEEALAAAFAAADRSGPLGGIPYFLKDMYPVAGEPMFAGSTFLPQVRPPPTRDGACVAALRAAGAVLAGQTHMHEFAYGLTGENPHYGDCEHPGYPGRTTGGSSSGSAAVVAAGIVPFAVGSDTGGSIRLPASYCGLFGFRLTPGHAWIQDAFPLVPTFDTPGWFTAGAADMRLALDALVPVPRAPVGSEVRPRGCYLELSGLEPEVARACRESAARFCAEADGETREDLLHHFSHASEVYNAIGIDEAWMVHRSWARIYRDRYDPAVWQRLIRVEGLTDAQRQAGRAGLATIRRAWSRYFRFYDFLVLPASPFPALAKPDRTPESRARILSLEAPASIGGLPVLTVPVPLPGGLTTGLQVVVEVSGSPALRWVLDQFGR